MPTPPLTKVHKFRHTLGLSQKQLATQCDVSWATIKRLERDEREGRTSYVLGMQVETYLKVCRGLGVRPRQLWRGLHA